jgi:hypothetical protein
MWVSLSEEWGGGEQGVAMDIPGREPAEVKEAGRESRNIKPDQGKGMEGKGREAA